MFRQCGSSGMTDRDAGMIFRVEEEDRGLRLDVFLANRFPDRSRSFMKKLILDGLVLVNGRTTVKPGYEVRADDEVSMTLPEADDTGELVPQSMPLDVLHEDEDIIVVNKAPGVVVHPGAGHSEGTLVHGLLAHCPRLAMQGAPKRPGIVHRLDQNTSGAMVVAKTEAAYLCLIRQFKEHQVFKEYRAGFRLSAGERSGHTSTGTRWTARKWPWQRTGAVKPYRSGKSKGTGGKSACSR